MKFDVIDLRSLGTANLMRGQRLAYGPGEGNELVKIGEVENVGVMLDQKKPVTTPGNIAGYQTIARHGNFDGGGPAVAGHILNGHRAVLIEDGYHPAHWGLDAMASGLDPAQIGEGRNYPNGAVPAHPDGPAVVEENYAGNRTPGRWLHRAVRPPPLRSCAAR